MKQMLFALAAVIIAILAAKYLDSNKINLFAPTITSTPQASPSAQTK